MNGLSVKVKIEGLERLERAIESLQTAVSEFEEAAALVTVIAGGVSNMNGIKKLEEFLERYKKDSDFLVIELGRVRYEELMNQISEIIKRHNILPSQAEKLFTHLVDTFRAEHTHV